MDFQPLHTARLDLVRTDPAHAEALFLIYGDSETVRFYPKAPCPSVEACREVVAQMLDAQRQGQGFRWSIRLRRTGQIVGSLGFHAWDRRQRRASFSYELIPAARGRGYAAEAARAVLAFGFERMGLRDVLAEIHAANAPSIRLAEALGFVRDGAMVRVWQGEALEFGLFILPAPPP